MDGEPQQYLAKDRSDALAAGWGLFVNIVNPLLEQLKQKVKDFPTSPGVYLMKGEGEKILYVGKAKNLRSRVRSYLGESRDIAPKTRHLVSHIRDIETMLTNTEVEAFLLEASLIKKHRPRYNIRLKDDKAYPYIRLSLEDEFPRLYLSRKVKKDGSAYFGPYTRGSAVAATIRFLNQTFRIRDCRDAFMQARKRPCLTHQIGRCTAPCVKLVTPEEYGRDVKAAMKFLRGQNKKALGDLQSRMAEAAETERFEAAAKLRDAIRAIETILEKQSVVSQSELDQDVVGFKSGERGTMVALLHVRQGRVVGAQSNYLSGMVADSPDEDEREWLVSFLNQYYADNFVPDEVLTSVDLGFDMNKLLADVLRTRKEAAVTVQYPTHASGHSLIEMVEANAAKDLESHLAQERKKHLGLEMIALKLGLKAPPRRMECFDISNFQGSATVASQVVFEEGRPSKDHYRRYRLRSTEGAPDDFASMREVLSRRFEHKEWDLPDLLVIDGGKGQLKVAVEVLRDLGYLDQVPVVGLAKARVSGSFQDQDVDSSDERFFLPGRNNPVVFPKNSEALHILTGLRDEAHRFAITYHRKVRDATSLESELDMIVGLGVKRKTLLLKKFKSVDEIRAASVDDLSALPTFNRVLAERVLTHLLDDSME